MAEAAAILTLVLGLTTLLLCYAGYIFFVVDKRQDKQYLENPELYDELDDKDYNFILPGEIDEYEETRSSCPTDKCAATTPPIGLRALAGLPQGLVQCRPASLCSESRARVWPSPSVRAACLAPLLSLLRSPTDSTPYTQRRRTLPVALLNRAMADIPRIEQLEKDHPRMARLFNRGLLPFGVWEQLLEAEALMDHEVHDVQAEAEKLQKGWGQGVFGQAYSMLRRQRQEEQQHAQLRREAAVLTLEFTKLSGSVVTFVADGRSVTAQTQMLLRKDSVSKEIAFKTDCKAELVVGSGEEQQTYSCEIPEMTLDKDSDKPQWMQLGKESTGLRLQVKFVRKTDGLKTGFGISDIRATAPPSAQSSTPAPAVENKGGM